MIRDTYKSNSFFEASISESDEVKNLCVDLSVYDELVLKKRPIIECEGLMRAAYTVLKRVLVMYANGSGKDDLNNYFQEYIYDLSTANDCTLKLSSEIFNKSSYKAEIVAPRLISCSIVYGECLGFSQTDLIEIASCIPSGIEQLVDRSLNHYQPDRPISNVLKEKGKYKQLIEILGSDDKTFQAKKLKNYLDQWPKKLGIRAPDGPRPLHETPTYDGYWCYEACAVVIVCDIDDESFKDHEFYPSELMSWRK